MLIDFKDDDFDTKVKSEDISILQYSASWCAPCRALKPVMEKLSDEFKDKANFYYADIDENAINSASAAGVTFTPNLQLLMGLPFGDGRCRYGCADPTDFSF